MFNIDLNAADQKPIHIILQDTSDLNEQYCNEYEKIFSHKRGVAVDYSAILAQVDVLHTQLAALIATTAARESGDQETHTLLDSLKNYQELLQKRISDFHDFIDHLDKKAKGGHYSYFSYLAQARALGRLEKKNKSIGGRLQSIAIPYLAKYTGA